MSAPDHPLDRQRLRQAAELLLDMSAIRSAARDWLRNEIHAIAPSLRPAGSTVDADAVVDRLLATVDHRLDFQDAATSLIAEITVGGPRR